MTLGPQADVDRYYRRIDAYIAERVRSGLYSWFPVWFKADGRCTALEIADNHTALFLYGLKPRMRHGRFETGSRAPGAAGS